MPLDRYEKAVLGVFSAGLGIRLIVFWLLHDNALQGDALAYHLYAVNLSAGKTVPPVLAPGLPLMEAAVYTLTEAEPVYSMLLMLLFHCVFSLLLFVFCRRHAGGLAAVACLSVFSFYPAFVMHSVWPLTQLPAATFLLAVVYLFCGPGRNHPGSMGLAGLLLGALILVRPGSLVLLPVLSAICLLWSGERRIVRTGIFTFACIALIGAWSWKACREAGSPVFINYTNSMNFYLGNNPWTPLYKTWWFGSHGEGYFDVPPEFSGNLARIRSLPLAERDAIYWHHAMEHILKRPGLFLLRSFNRIRCLLAFDTYSGTAVIKKFGGSRAAGLAVIAGDALFCNLVFLCALVWWLALRKCRPPEKSTALIILACMAAYAIPYTVAFSHPTYHFPIMPLAGVFAASSLAAFTESPGLPQSWRLIRKGSYGLLFAACVIIYIQLEWIFVMYESYGAIH